MSRRENGISRSSELRPRRGALGPEQKLVVENITSILLLTRSHSFALRFSSVNSSSSIWSVAEMQMISKLTSRSEDISHGI